MKCWVSDTTSGQTVSHSLTTQQPPCMSPFIHLRRVFISTVQAVSAESFSHSRWSLAVLAPDNSPDNDRCTSRAVTHCNTDVRIAFFTNRVVDIRNSLPAAVVFSHNKPIILRSVLRQTGKSGSIESDAPLLHARVAGLFVCRAQPM